MWRKRKQQDFQAEIEAHLQLEADQLRAEGKPPAEALANARRAFGNRTIAEERFQEASGWLWLKHLIQRCPLRCVTLAGLGGCFALTSMMANLLYEVSPRDAVTFIAALVLLMLVAAAALFGPTRRASRTDPLVALRCD